MAPNRFTFTKATKRQSRLRLGLAAPAGGGKTYTALKIATAIAEHFGGRVAVMDTEHGSAAKYSDVFDFDHITGDDLPDYSPRTYTSVIKAAEQQGYTVLVIDGISPAWDGEGGVMEMVDAKAGQSGNKWAAWGDVTPHHRRFIDAMLKSKCHIIATMRVKTEWTTETYTANGRTKERPVKIGLKPIQRDGMDYEFDVVGDLDNAILTFSKTRCTALKDRRFIEPGDEFAEVLIKWLSDGAPIDDATPEQVDEARALLARKRVRPESRQKIADEVDNNPTAERIGKILDYLRARPDTVTREDAAAAAAIAEAELERMADEVVEQMYGANRGDTPHHDIADQSSNDTAADPGDDTPEPEPARSREPGEDDGEYDAAAGLVDGQEPPASGEPDDMLKRERHGKYFAALKKHRPDMYGTADIATRRRRKFQNHVTGKASTAEWEVSDYDKAIQYLRDNFATSAAS